MTTAGPKDGASRVAGSDLERLRIDRGGAPERSPWRWAVLVGAILLLVVGALVLRARTGLGRGVRVEETAIVLQPARGSGGGDVLTANGYVKARHNAAVSAEVQGRLARLYVEEGSRVQQGDLLAELANEDLRARLAQAEAELGVRQASIDEARSERNDAENTLARAKALLERGLGTQQALDAAQARYDLVNARIATAMQTLSSAQAGLRLARADLAKTTIRAPFSGTVLRKDAEVGEMVAPVSLGGSGSRGAIVTLASLDSLDVEVDVNEAYIGRLHLGQPARAVTDAYPDTAFRARVRQIVPTSDRQKATVLVKAEILRADVRLLPDMGAKVTFESPGDAAVANALSQARPTVAAAAVQRDGDQSFVWLVGSTSLAEKRVVQLGATANGRVEIAAGLTGGEIVVVRAARPLHDGQKLQLPGPF